ncbi:hypothetical protein [Granulicella sp. L60]|jgi:hypothetical protein|uniref:hypothetical protein n=1 Tax=Granulicella sp. L60 TaxID=1641866 RepID=UPI00131EC275|nr:hypothetical protein [Granulicella sp. L60]
MSFKELPTECICETYNGGHIIAVSRTTNKAYDAMSARGAEPNDAEQKPTNLIQA